MPSRFLRLFGSALAVLWLSGCVATPQTQAVLSSFSTPTASVPVLPPSHLLDEVPFFAQEQFQCGPAALATVLQASRVNVTPEPLVAEVYVPERQGSLQIEMLAAARRHGRIAHLLPGELDSVLRQVHAGKPVLVMQNLGLRLLPQWHYAVVVGFDLARKEIVLNSGMTRHYRMPLSVFERTWQRAGHWAVVVLAPGELPEDTRELAYVDALAAFAIVSGPAALEASYRAGLHRWPSSRLLGMGLANLSYTQGDFAAASVGYEAVLRAWPQEAAAHNNLAQALFRLGETDMARTHAELAVSLGGRFADTYQATLDTINGKTAP